MYFKPRVEIPLYPSVMHEIYSDCVGVHESVSVKECRGPSKAAAKKRRPSFGPCAVSKCNSRFEVTAGSLGNIIEDLYKYILMYTYMYMYFIYIYIYW